MKTAIKQSDPAQLDSRFFSAYEMVNQCCIDSAIQHFDTINGLSESSIDTKYRYLVSTIIGILQEEALIHKSPTEHTRWIKNQSPRWTGADCEQKCALAIQKFPECRGMFELIQLAHNGIEDFLNGEKTGIDILFPKGDGSVWYRYNVENRIVEIYAEWVSHVIESRTLTQQKLTCIELGAGTGACTSRLLPRIRNNIHSYTFTDIGSTFLQSARKQFKDYPFMRYQKLDIDNPLSPQNVTPESVDLVIAVNVLHSAKNLEWTLNNIRRVLRPDGAVVIGEGSPPSHERRWRPDLIFALLDGWWNVETTHDRPRAGFLFPNEWRELFKKSGFKHIESFPGKSYYEGNDCYGGVVTASV